jgi:hypothetical protein
LRGESPPPVIERCRAAPVGSDFIDEREDRANKETSMKYMLMMNAPRGDGAWNVSTWAPQDLKAHIDFMVAHAKDLEASGELVAAEGLAGPGEARIVRATKSGVPAVTDGPYPEGKEFLAGYLIVDVPTTERAYEIAARTSSAPGKGGAPMYLAIEVRQVMSAPPTEM